MKPPWEGVWEILTETSRYVVDFEEKTVTRIPGEGTGDDPTPGLPPAILVELRRDAEPIRLMAMLHLEVGHPMQMLLDLRGDNVMTVRTTTIVGAIRPMAPLSRAKRP